MVTLIPSSTVPNSYTLDWSAQQTHILEGLRTLVGQDDLLLTDVTLACDGEYVQAHKLVLSLCSSFFKDLFQKNRADKSSAIVILGNNVNARNLRYLLQFMYQGRVDIPSEDVDSFLEAGNALKVEGLVGNVGDSCREARAHSQNPATSSVGVNKPSHSESEPRPGHIICSSSTSSSFAPAWSKSTSSTVARNNDESQMKKRRISGSEHSTNDYSPLPNKIVSMVSTNVDQSTIDPLDLDGTEAARFHPGRVMGADIEEHLTLNDVKSELNSIFTGYDSSGHSEIMQNEEGVYEDSYDESMGEVKVSVEPSHPVSLSVSLPQVPVPGPSTSSHAKRMTKSIARRKRRRSFQASKTRCETLAVSGTSLESNANGEYICKTCEKIFKSITKFLEHERVHTGERPFSCDICNDTFTVKSNLRRHINSVHLQQKRFECIKCKRKFSTQKNRDYHINICDK